MGIGEAEVFSERLKRELHALEAANVHAILETEHLVDEVNHTHTIWHYVDSITIELCYHFDYGSTGVTGA